MDRPSPLQKIADDVKIGNAIVAFYDVRHAESAFQDRLRLVIRHTQLDVAYDSRAEGDLFVSIYNVHPSAPQREIEDMLSAFGAWKVCGGWVALLFWTLPCSSDPALLFWTPALLCLTPALLFPPL